MSATLHSTALRVLAAIAALPPTANNDALGAHAGVCGRTAGRHLVRLAQVGLIRVDRRSPNAGGPGTDPGGRSLFAVAHLDDDTPTPAGAATCAPGVCDESVADHRDAKNA